MKSLLNMRYLELKCLKFKKKKKKNIKYFACRTTIKIKYLFGWEAKKYNKNKGEL